MVLKKTVIICVHNINHIDIYCRWCGLKLSRQLPAAVAPALKYKIVKSMVESEVQFYDF